MTIGIGALIQRVSVFRQAVSVGPWNPAQLGASLALWLDADDSSTITLNGSNVAQWDDKSGNDLHLAQSSAAAQPVYLPTGLGANSAVHFDATTKSLIASTASDWSFLHDSGGSAIFLVNQLQPLGTTSPRYILLTRTGPTGILHGVRDLSAGAFPLGTLFEDGVTTLPYTPAPAASTPADETHIIEWEHGLGRTNDFGIYVDGDQKANANYTTDPVGGVTADGPLRVGQAQMYTGEMVILNALPSTTDRQKLEGYLAWKWGGIPQERAWAPSDLGADLALWLDADDSSTITLNGSNVAQWDDKSGNGRNISQAVATNQPSYNTRTLNSKNTIEFSGNQMLFSTASVLSGNPDVLMAVVVQFDTNVNATDDRSVQLSAGAGTSYSITGGTQGYSARFNNGNEIYGATSLATPLIQIGTRPSGSDYAASQMFISGTESARTSGGNDTGVPVIGNGVSVGAGAISSDPLGSVGSPMDGFIAETVIAEDVTLSTRQKLEGYLAHKWGLTANLPVDHPYKDAAPTVAI